MKTEKTETKIITATTELTDSSSYTKIYKAVGVTLTDNEKKRLLRSIALALDSNPSALLKSAAYIN